MLGQVDHFYWKKEYQARGAPHYHVLLWIQNAPVIGQDEPDQILAWLQARITCRIPNVKSDPYLHRLVTRYQMHKGSAYCKRGGDAVIPSLQDAGLDSLAKPAKRHFTLRRGGSKITQENLRVATIRCGG